MRAFLTHCCHKLGLLYGLKASAPCEMRSFYLHGFAKAKTFKAHITWTYCSLTSLPTCDHPDCDDLRL